MLECPFYLCKRCSERASVEEVSSVMSVLGCEKCSVFEVLGQDDVRMLDHFSFLDDVESGGKWMN